MFVTSFKLIAVNNVFTLVADGKRIIPFFRCTVCVKNAQTSL